MENNIVLTEDLLSSWIEANVGFNQPIEVQAEQLAKFFEMFGLTTLSEYKHIAKLLEFLLNLTAESTNSDIADKYITLSLVEAVRIMRNLEGRLMPDMSIWE